VEKTKNAKRAMRDTNQQITSSEPTWIRMSSNG